MTEEMLLSQNETQSIYGLEFLWLELTDKCNLNCVHCYANSSPRVPMHQRMQFEDWLKTLYDAYQLGCHKIQFIGGEPTVYPHLSKLIEYATELGYSFIEVFTNGTTFTENIKQTFLKHKVCLAFSVYSSEESVHDSVTLHQDSLKRTVESLRWALDSGLSVRAAIIDLGINSNTVEQTREFLTRLGVNSVRIDRNRGIGRASSHVKVQSQFDELCGNCWQGKLCVTPSGEIFPCVFSRFASVGSIKQGLSNVLQGEKLLGFRSTLRSRSQLNKPVTSNCEPVCQPVCSPTPCTPQCGPDCGPAKCSPQDR